MTSYTIDFKTRFIFNTDFPDTPTSTICYKGLSKHLKEAGYDVTLNDWDHYDQYDVAIFMPYDSEVQKARHQNPDIIIGFADPKIKKHVENAKEADFLLVSSYEQRDTWLKYNRNIFIYYMFPETEHIPKVHKQKDKIIVGYHGNKIHLNCMYPNVTLALEELSRDFEVEFWALYGYESSGMWGIGLPDPTKVKTVHINWSTTYPNDNYRKLVNIDIGICPTLIPIKMPQLFKFLSKRSRRSFLEDSNDYFTRYKCSSGPGRHYVFSQLEIPIVTDFFPSGSRFIQHEETGFIAYSPEGWYEALFSLASDPELRNSMAQNCYRLFNENFSREITFNKFLHFLNQVISDKASNKIKRTIEIKSTLKQDISYNFYIKKAQIFYPFVRLFRKIIKLFG
jgi:hypothetical protein